MPTPRGQRVLFERLHMAFYRAVAANGRELVFAADATELLLSAGEQLDHPNLRIEPFPWRVAVPR